MGLQRDIFMGFKVNGAVNLHVFREWAAPVGERFQKLLTFSKYVRRVRFGPVSMVGQFVS